VQYSTMQYSTIVCLVSFLLVVSAPVIHAESAAAMTNDDVPVYGIDNHDPGSAVSGNSRCCLGIRGNVDGDIEELVNITDMTYLIAYLFSGGAAPPCFEEGDVNADGLINITDMTYLIAYLFSGGLAPEECPGVDCPPTVTDYDGNVYETVLIGDQCWMMEHLKVTHYRNGDAIPHVTDGSIWSGLSTGAYCEYDNNPGHVATYGRLYNWYAVADPRNIAPEGWHVPTDDEWKQLEMHLGMSQAEADGGGLRGTDEGGKLKDTTVHWASPNTGATNESGFSGLPGGSRIDNGNFSNMGNVGFFWTATESSSYAWYRTLHYLYSQVPRGATYKHRGFSVRCVRD
jgi:uncharacterized protein (TIGR02145 family)